MITYERLTELLDYDPETGIFIRKKSLRSKRWVGKQTGSINDQGYQIILADGRKYRAHHLAWLWVYGKWPDQYIDHINHDRADNRIVNLRDVDHSTNLLNRAGKTKSKQSSNSLGVWFDKRNNKYVAELKYRKQRRLFKRFETEAEAKQAYDNTKEELAG